MYYMCWWDKDGKAIAADRIKLSDMNGDGTGSQSVAENDGMRRRLAPHAVMATLTEENAAGEMVLYRVYHLKHAPVDDLLDAEVVERNGYAEGY